MVSSLKKNKEKPVGFGPFSLNSSCFEFVNWLWSLWPSFFLFTLYTWEVILLLHDLPPAQYAFRAHLVLHLPLTLQVTKGQKAEQMRQRTDSKRGMARTLFNLAHLQQSASGGRVEVTCFLQVQLQCRLYMDICAGPPRYSCGSLDAQRQNIPCDTLNESMKLLW